MKTMLRAVCVWHALLLIAALCQAASAQEGLSLSERVTRTIEHEEPAWKVVRPLRGALEVLPYVSGAWEADGYQIQITLSVHPSGREAAEALANRFANITQMPRSPLTTARNEFRRANVVVTVDVNLIGATPALAATAESKAAALSPSAIAERARQLVEALISAEVRVDACVNELYPDERVGAGAPRDTFFRDAAAGCVPRVAEALRSGVDANAHDEWGTPVLALAVAAGQREVVRLLLRAGAAPNATERSSSTIAFRILSRPSTYRGQDLPGILKNQIQILDDLLAAGAKLEAVNQAGRTVLLEVVRMNYDDGSPAVLLNALIERGANFAARDSQGRTALMLAVLNTHPKVSLQTLQVLLHAGSDVNARDKSGKTALGYAMERTDSYSNQEWGACLSLLRSYGAIVVRDRAGAMRSPKSRAEGFFFS